MQLRPYQRAAVDQVAARLDENPCLTAPTGSGKTVMLSTLIAEGNLRALWIVHRRELVAQAAGTLRRLGLRCGIVMATQTPDPAAPVQVASVQTLARRPIPRCDVVVIDEAHHARASCYKHILDGAGDVPRVGGTATPFRLDSKGLGDIFGAIVVAAYPDELVEDGTLVEPVVYAPAVPDMAGVKVRHGDYSPSAIGELMGKPKLVGDIVETWRKLALNPDGTGRRTVVFAVNVQHSQQIVQAFKDAGVRAEHIDGSTPKTQRDATLHRLRIGYTTVVSQCQILTEGWDLPDLEVGIVARPTKSLCLHLQIVGRVCRAAPAKLGAIILDHAGNHLRHGPMSQRLEYSLADGVAPKSAGTPNEVPSKRCPACYLVVRAGLRECPGCQQVFKTDLPATTAGELVEFSAKPRPPLEEQQRAWFEIEDQREHYGFQPGWSFVRFKERMGFTPVVLDGLVVDGATAPARAMEEEYDRLADVARIRGYKPGWVGHQLAAKFGPRAWAYVQRRKSA